MTLRRRPFQPRSQPIPTVRQRLATPASGPLLTAATFDPVWYLLAYSDAREEIEAGRCADAHAHYLDYGAAAGRDPNARFSESAYRANNPDVKAEIEAGRLTSGFEHFVASGRHDGRRPNGMVVDEGFYRARYPDATADLAAGRFASAYEHYLEVGAAAGHDPHAAFSEKHYREQYPEVAELVAQGRYLSGYHHFLSRGLDEGRRPHPSYSESHYRRLHPDVDDAIRRGELACGYLQLIETGLAEGRRWKREGDAGSPTSGPLLTTATFDPVWYLLAYPDAREEIEAGRCADAQAHYLEHDAAAGRDPNARFSESAYRAKNPDVAAEIEAGRLTSGFEHFVASGRHDGRRPNALVVDEDFYRARYPDAAADLAAGRFVSAYEHYLEVGAAAGHDPHAAFSEKHYREQYPDIAELVAQGRYLSGYHHFLSRGLDEGRRPHPLFSESHYRRLHPDVDDAIRRGELACGYQQLIETGLAEGRRWKTADEAARLRRAATRLAHCRLDELLASDRELRFEAPANPRASVLLVLFNRAELTLACLEALGRISQPSWELIVIDNRSTDRTRELLPRLRGATIVRNEDNLGFLRAANQAAAEARGELLLFMNNDAELLPSSLQAAADRLATEPDAGAVGGRVVGIDGRLEEAGSIVWRDGTTGGYGRGGDPADGAFLFPREVDYCSGVFLLTPRRLFTELGGFDERYVPAYYEESDYCFRLREEGHKVFYEPRSVVLHHGSASLPDETHVSRLLARNRAVFAERHREALAGAHPAATTHLFQASDRRRFCGRVLFLDDHVPLESLGGGAPRAQEILRALCELGYFVTFYATNPIELDVSAALAEMPEPNLELIHHRGKQGFGDFWNARPSAYELVIVSRRHNFQWLLDDGFDPRARGIRLIYDAESVAARRRERQIALLGAGAPAESEVSVEEEIALAQQASEIWAVSADEASLLRSANRPASVVAHGERGKPGPRAFEDRRGILFVGRLDEAWNPNVDGLRWYLEEVHPRIEKRLGKDARMTVVGEPGEVELPRPRGVRFLGRVDDLEPLYDRHRVFVAPTRFAAGIPKKVTSAAAHGLPVAATSLLVRQLGWDEGVEIVDGGDNDPVRFAARTVDLYGNAQLWQAVRARALDRARREHGSEALKRSLKRALGNSCGV